MTVIRDLHADDPGFGSRFISDELERAGHRVGERWDWRLCSEHRIWSTTTKKGRNTSGKRPVPAVHDDLWQRNLTAPASDRVGLTDITDHWTDRGNLGEAHGVTKTFVVTFEFSSLVLLELLARRSDHNHGGNHTGMTIEEVPIVNDGLVADSHGAP